MDGDFAMAVSMTNSTQAMTQTVEPAGPPAGLPVEVRDATYVVIPAYNEASSVEQVVRSVRTHYPNVVVVDDGSSDQTFAAAKRAGAMALRHVINRGQGASLQTGIQFALARGAQYVVTFDADGQHQVEDIQALVEPVWRGKCEVTLGSRFLGQAVNLPSSRRWLLLAGVLFTRLVNGLKLTDTHNGLRVFSRAAAEKLDIQLDGMAHASEIIDIISRQRLTFREVPVRIHYTDYSLAKGQTSRSALRIVLQYLLGRFVG
jgi:glycosyltransferase involved in cell wall biosynthesis